MFFLACGGAAPETSIDVATLLDAYGANCTCTPVKIGRTIHLPPSDCKAIPGAANCRADHGKYLP